MIRLILLLLTLVFSKQSLAASAEEAVVESCTGYIESQVIPEDSVCFEYINGFIDGAVLTDRAIIENLTQEEKQFSNFFERAYKTRVGNKRKTLPPTYFAKFCLPEDQSRKAVVEQLIHEFDADVMTQQSFSKTLYDTLKRVYSCD